MPPRALRRAAAAAPLRLRAPPPRSAGLKPGPAPRSGAPPLPPPIGCPRSRLPPPGLGPRPLCPPAAWPGHPELAIGPRSRGPARRPAGDSEPDRPHIPRELNACPHPTRAAGTAGSGRRSGSKKRLSPSLPPSSVRLPADSSRTSAALTERAESDGLGFMPCAGIPSCCRTPKPGPGLLHPSPEDLLHGWKLLQVVGGGNKTEGEPHRLLLVLPPRPPQSQGRRGARLPGPSRGAPSAGLFSLGAERLSLPDLGRAFMYY
nr:basic salivary proline-rich protein 2 [Marmota flaviventris]